MTRPTFPLWLSAGFIALLFAILVIIDPIQAATPNVGQHIHLEVTNMPVDGFPVAQAPYTFHAIIKLHDQPGRVGYLRVDDYSTIKYTRTLSLGPCSDCTLALDVTLDFTSWTVGRHELRWHTDIADADPTLTGNQRQFQASETPVCIGSCLPNVSGRATPFHAGSGWYTDHSYSHALVRSPDTAFKPCGSVVAQTYDHGTRLRAFLNPDFHNGTHGTPLGDWPDALKHTIVIPCSAVPGDKLVILGDDGQNAGILRSVLGTGAIRATADYEYQSWWARTGLVLP